MNVSPSPEFALVLDAIAPRPAPRVDYRSWSDARWQNCVQVAEWHRLAPALFAHVRTAGGAPPQVFAELERRYLANAARNLFIGAALNNVVDALSSAGIPVMLLKGAALVEAYYPDPAQREMLDLDLLLPGDRIEAGSSALEAVGYVPDEDGTEGPKHLRLDHHHDAPLVGEQQLVAIELHRHLTIAGEGARFRIDDVWSRATAVPGKTQLLPAGEDLMLHVCVHFTRNRLGGSFRRRQTGGALAQIADIARIVDRQTTDWEVLADSALRYGLGTRVFLALFAARELGVAVPSEALAALEPPGFQPDLGRRLVTYRVLMTDDRLPVRSVRWMIAPSREVLTAGWDADPQGILSLTRAYIRRAYAHAPLIRSALHRPLAAVQDRRLNGEIYTLEDHG